MRTLELKKKSLEELSKEYGLLTDIEQRGCIGGGDGSYDNPWTWDEYNSSNSCYEGYVNICGLVTYILPAAVCTASYKGKTQIMPYGGATYSYPSYHEGNEVLHGYFNDANTRAGIASAISSAASEFKGAFRITDSFGQWDFHPYNTVQGNQFCNASKALAYGKVMKTPELMQILGKFSQKLSVLGVVLSYGEWLTAENCTDRMWAAGGMICGIIGLASGGWVGIAIPIAYCGLQALCNN